jgi:hypothetical protein
MRSSIGEAVSGGVAADERGWTLMKCRMGSGRVGNECVGIGSYRISSTFHPRASAATLLRVGLSPAMPSKPLSLSQLLIVALLLSGAVATVWLGIGRGRSAGIVLPVMPGNVHSHNDCAQPVPLKAALDAGVASVEVDVHLLNDRLVVGLDKDSLDPARTLVLEYLEPLRQRIASNRDGWVYPGGAGRTIVLLVDIKSDAAAALDRLERELKDFTPMLTSYDSTLHLRPVTVVITGQRDTETVVRHTPRFVFLDSRPSEPALPYQVAPLVSDAWADHFKWDGTGTMPPDELAKLQSHVKRFHVQRKLVRFWNAPDTEACWRAQRNAGVDLIHSNKPAAAVKSLAQP